MGFWLRLFLVAMLAMFWDRPTRYLLMLEWVLSIFRNMVFKTGR